MEAQIPVGESACVCVSDRERLSDREVVCCTVVQDENYE